MSQQQMGQQRLLGEGNAGPIDTTTEGRAWLPWTVATHHGAV